MARRIPRGKRPSVKDVLKKYGGQIEKKIDSSPSASSSAYSSSYVGFKKEMSPELSRYEKLAKSLGKSINFKVSEKDAQKVQKQLDIAHLDVRPSEALALGVMSFLAIFFVGLLSSIAVVLIKGSISAFPLGFFMLVLFASVFLFYYVNGYPARLANKWRLKASSQMVPALLYVVVYMRHTPNLEKAIAFTSDNLQDPLALDFKKVFYDVEVGKFSTIKESLDGYLETWRDYSVEFIEAFHLIESSLFEPDNSRRISTLEKSLQVVLDGVYDKMLKFSHNVKSPLTNVYMLAVMLPVLGIALIPLASALVGDFITAIHIFVLYNLLIPFIAFFMIDKILLLRPGGYGESKLLERNPLYYKFKSKKPYTTAFVICLPFLILGLLPLIFQFTPIPEALGMQKDFTLSQVGLTSFDPDGRVYFFDFKEDGSGPYGIGAVFLSLFIPLGVALFYSIAYRERTKELIKERKKTKQLEAEFNNSLFQLGNRLGNGVPPELVFGKVAESAKGLRTGEFFKRVNYNIRQMGMSVEKAIFDRRRGAIQYYPSDLIASSMRILVEASKKGLKIAAISLMSISEYAKNISKITQRLKDLLAETVSSMKSNMTFLAPLLSGIVVGLAAMITSILNKLEIAKGATGSAEALGGLGGFLETFSMSSMIPPYYLQIAIGIYLVQIIFILTGTLVTVDSGEDKLEKAHKIGVNLKRGIGLYFVVALIAVLVLFILSSVVLGNL